MVVLGGEVVAYAYERGVPVDLALDLVLHEEVDNRRVAWPLSFSLTHTFSLNSLAALRHTTQTYGQGLRSQGSTKLLCKLAVGRLPTPASSYSPS